MDVRALAQMMMSARNEGIGPRAILQQFAAESDDPALSSLVATMLAGDAPAPAVEVDSDTTLPSAIELRLLLREAQAQLRSLTAEVHALRERNDALAEALGACPACFGETTECATCSGRGEPGSVLPEPDGFRKYVAPAVKQVQRELRSVQSRAARTPSARRS